MRFTDSTLRLPPPPPPPAPDHPVPPWRIELVEYVARVGVPGETRPTKVYPDGRRGELLVPGTEEEVWHRYATWLEGELNRVREQLSDMLAANASGSEPSSDAPDKPGARSDLAKARANDGPARAGRKSG